MKMRRTLAAFVLCTTTGCSSLQPVSVQSLAEKPPPVVYITQGNGVVVPVYEPRLRGDTLVGSKVVMPLGEVQRIAVLQVSKGRTAMLVSGIVIVSAMGVYAISAAAGGRSDWYCDYSGRAIEELGVPRCGPGGPML